MALTVYTLSLSIARDLAPVLDSIGKRDPDLGRQMRRAITSIPLNIAEGEHAIGRNQVVRFATAMGSAREVRACVDVARALGYVRDGVDDDDLNRLIATLYRLSVRRG